MGEQYLFLQKETNPATEESDCASTSTSKVHTDSNTPDGVAHKIAMRFKDLGSKFSSDIGECLQEYVDKYGQVASHYGLNDKQRLQISYIPSSPRMHSASTLTT